MSILDEYPWASEAQELLRKVAEIPRQTKVIMILRHSHRGEPSRLGMINDIPLTEEGRLVAREFGTSLPEGRNYRIFYSEIERCKDTAQLIAEGLNEKGINLETIEPSGILKGMAGVGSEIEKLTHRDKHEAILKWAAGHYPETIIEPLHSYAQRAANVIWSSHQQAAPSTIDICISHDFHIMALQFGWFGEWMHDEWVDYLGGFLMQLEADRLIFYKNGRIKSIPYPFWWPMQNLEIKD